MDTDKYDNELCNMCARLCHDNIDMNVLKSDLTCKGIVENEDGIENEQTTTAVYQNQPTKQIDIDKTIREAMEENNDKGN